MKYEPTWNSLKRHRLPEWLDDAKFGIYFHWGIYSVPAYGNEWYPHQIYNGGICHPYHVKTYGEPDEFGYKDFISDFNAEKFDADEWAKFFKDTGAKFAGPVAEHHDGFSMWNSEVNKWNAVNMGPKRDIVGEIGEAIKKQGMKFITTFHHSHNWYYYYHMDGLDTADPEYSGLYGKPHIGSNYIGTSDATLDRPDKDFCDVWFQKIKEVIDNYEPDLIWYDFGLHRIPDVYKRIMCAYYYNMGEEWGRDVEIIYKDHHLPPRVGLLDYERGRSDKLTWHTWITDTIMGTKSWSYIEDEVYKPANTLIHNFCDRIAKNGYLFLNFGPRADGTIPDEIISRFKEMGEWLKINGEAVYNSTPWSLAEEGPTIMEKSGGFSEHKEVAYTSKDLRFVCKDNNLYVFALGWPGKELVIKSLCAAPKKNKQKEFYIIEDSDIRSIILLGNEGDLEWKLTNEGLKIQLPDKKPCNHAFTFKIAWKDIKL